VGPCSSPTGPRLGELQGADTPPRFFFCRRRAPQRAFAVTSAGIEGGKNLAESARDLERTRKAIQVQLHEFEGVKKSLMRDLQNRCEKVC